MAGRNSGRPAHQGFNRHTFVNVAHTDREFDGGKFDCFVAGILDLFPANVAASPVNFDARLVLTDERVFGEGRERSVGEQLFSAVNCLGTWREDLDDQNRVVDFVRREIHRLAGSFATYHQVGVVVSISLRHAYFDIVNEYPTRGVTQMRVKSGVQVPCDHVVPERSAV